jgi:nucleoside-diphosphate-sugar epimerase
MEDQRVLVVGCTGQVGFPVASALAANNEVWGVARFRNTTARDRLEACGVHCVSTDLAQPDLSGVPTNIAYVFNFAVSRTGVWPDDLDINAGSVAFVMEHCQRAAAMLHCSTTGVYQPSGGPYREDDPLGDNHRAWEPTLPFLSTYSITKIAAEAAARYGARRFQIPTVIARLGVPYGDNGGWPALHLDLMAAGLPIEIHPSRPNRFNPIHEDDIAASLAAVMGAASIPPTVVNWAGPESSIEAWCELLGTLTGQHAAFVETNHTITGIPVDTTRFASLGGRASVPLAAGLRRLVAALRPDLLKSGS